MNAPATVDAILRDFDKTRVAPPPVPALTDSQLLANERVQQLIVQSKIDAADEAGAYFLHIMLLGIENLANGNKLVAGRAFDDALTHFLADLKAELGEGFASNAAALLIRNLALFLRAKQRDLVLAALDVEAK